MKWALVILLGLVGVIAWVRLAPSDAARWHQVPDAARAGEARNGALRVIEEGSGGLARLDGVIRQTPRTRVLAGSPEDGMVTYVTRSAVFGFPDYTTVHRRGDMLEIYGRARFGLSDLGVNAARIDGWLDALAQGG